MQFYIDGQINIEQARVGGRMDKWVEGRFNRWVSGWVLKYYVELRWIFLLIYFKVSIQDITTSLQDFELNGGKCK